MPGQASFSMLAQSSETNLLGSGYVPQVLEKRYGRPSGCGGTWTILGKIYSPWEMRYYREWRRCVAQVCETR